MGYSQSKKAIEKVRIVLDIMIAQKDKFMLPCKDPLRMSYALRDAIAVAKRLPSESTIAALGNKYKIKIRENGLMFELKTRLEWGEFEPVAELAKSFESMTIESVSDVMEIVGACIKHKAPQFIFPDAALDEEEIVRLEKWTGKSGYTIVSHLPLQLRKNVEVNNETNGGATHS